MLMFPLDYVKLQEVYSALKLLSASTAFCDKPDSVLGRAVMALPLFFIHGKLTQKDTHVSLLNYSFRLS